MMQQLTKLRNQILLDSARFCEILGVASFQENCLIAGTYITLFSTDKGSLVHYKSVYLAHDKLHHRLQLPSGQF